MFGTTIDSEMDKAGRNAKGEKNTITARRRILDKYLRLAPAVTQGRYADPAKGKVVKL